MRNRINVSIHAPARGATVNVQLPVFFLCFNPRSRAGSDRLIKAFRHIIGGFNPRSRAGSDKQAEAAEDFGQVVSIHAPARGATWIRHWVFAQTSVSIHAPARGATRAAGIPQGENWFQSTLPRGERPDNSGYVAAYRGFNPRSRAGSDRLPKNLYLCTNVSIHAPARGATWVAASQSSAGRFQSTLPRGERHAVQRVRGCSSPVSIQAPARGATSVDTVLCRPHGQVSIHAPARGATLETILKQRKTLVSIHAPARGATRR